MVYKLFHRKSVGRGVNTHANKSAFNNEKLTEELHKAIIRKLKKRIVYSECKDNIWGTDLADIQLISKFNEGFRFLLCVIDIFRKYAWVVPLKDKKGVTITNAFQKMLKESSRCRQSQYEGRKTNRIWVDKGSEFCNNSFKNWLKDNDIEMYSIHKEENLLLLKDLRELQRLKSKYMTSISKNVYIRKLDDIVNECNNTCHRAIKMKPVDVKDNTYIDFKREVND